MLRKLISAFRQPKPAPTAQTQRRVSVASPEMAMPCGVPVYPPVDQGVAYAKADVVLATQTDMIRRLKLLSGFQDQRFEDTYLRVLRSLAGYVDLIPASESGTHMGAGGLFRLALEIGFFSRQASEAVLFASRAGVELRRDLEPRWRYATFLAGLCCELYRPLSRMIVVTEDGQEWPVHRMPLSEWLDSINAGRYYIRWVKETDAVAAGSATFLATKIIPESSLQYLQEGHPSIIPSMLDGIVGDTAKTKENQIAEIVQRIRQKVVERDQVLAPKNYGKLTVGAQLEPHLVDAMRQLVANGTWTINIKRSRIWYGSDGMFVIWRTAAKEILATLDSGAVNGIPRDATTLAEVLLRAGFFVADKQNDLYWKIKTPLSEGEFVAVRVANPESLLIAIEDEEKPAALDVALCVSSKTETKTANAAATANEPEAGEPPVMIVAQEPPSEKPPMAPESVAASEDSEPQAIPVEQSSKPRKEKPSAAGQKDRARPAAKERESDYTEPGAIKPVPELTYEQAFEMPEDVANRMSRLVREVMNQVINDYRSGAMQGAAEVINHGIAISLERLSSYGVELTKLLSELHGLGWLYVDPEKPSRKIHSAKIGNKSVQSAILKGSVAKDLGFVDAF